MRPVGMSDFEPHRRPGQAGSRRPGRAWPPPRRLRMNPATEPIAARRLDQGLRRNRPGRAGRARPSAIGRRPAADSCATAPGRSHRPRFRGRGRSQPRRDRAAGSMTVKTTRRVRRVGHCRRFPAPDRAAPAASRPGPRSAPTTRELPARRSLQHGAPHAPDLHRGSRRLVGTTSRCSERHSHISPAKPSGERPSCERRPPRIRPEDVKRNRDGNLGPRRHDPVTSAARPGRRPANPRQAARR